MIGKSSYKNLRVYKASKELVIQVYALVRKFPHEEQYALCDQLRRAVISIPSNIAEGMGRVSHKEQIHFIEIAFGSLMEVESQMDVACDLGYITPQELELIDMQVDGLAAMLSGLRNVRMNGNGERNASSTAERSTTTTKRAAQSAYLTQVTTKRYTKSANRQTPLTANR